MSKKQIKNLVKEQQNMQKFKSKLCSKIKEHRKALSAL